MKRSDGAHMTSGEMESLIDQQEETTRQQRIEIDNLHEERRMFIEDFESDSGVSQVPDGCDQFYLCNCGAQFFSPVERIAHMASCSVINRSRETRNLTPAPGHMVIYEDPECG